MENLKEQKIEYWDGFTGKAMDVVLLSEEPLSLRIQGKPYAVVMRTPGDEIAHMAGFCLAEGIVDSPDEFATLSLCEGENANVVTATLKPPRDAMAAEFIKRRSYISQTSCGICGKEVVSDLIQEIPPLRDNTVLDLSKAMERFEALSSYQPLRQITKTSHVAALFNSELELLCSAEDVGRHNALDKAIGKLFLDGSLQEAALMILSSRVSYEMVQKAGRARIPIIFAKSRPTDLAISLATELNLTVVCKSNDSGILIFCGGHRLRK